MLRRVKRHVSPGLILGVIALIVALGGTSVAVEQAQDAQKKQTLRTRIGGATKDVTQLVTLRPQAQNNGVSDHVLNCPNNPKLGQARAYEGTVMDIRPPDNTRDLAPLDQRAGGPFGNGWKFQFDNDTVLALQVELRVLCIFPKLNTKRG